MSRLLVSRHVTVVHVRKISAAVKLQISSSLSYFQEVRLITTSIRNFKKEEDKKQTKTAMENLETEEKTKEDEEDGKLEMVQAENEAFPGESSGGAIVVAAGGYNRERHPEDDCCPICFDAFKIPCRTSCGHWFCSSCILQYWRFKPEFKRSKCPMCSQFISKLIPESSALIQGEEIGNHLQDIQLYNRLHVGGWRGLFKKALTLPWLIRTSFREYLNLEILKRIDKWTRVTGLLLAILYESCGFNFFPNGGHGIIMMFEFGATALFIFLILDAMWFRRTRTRRARNLVHLQPPALQ